MYSLIAYTFLLESLSHIITCILSPLLAHEAINKAPSFILFCSFNTEQRWTHLYVLKKCLLNEQNTYFHFNVSVCRHYKTGPKLSVWLVTEMVIGFRPIDIYLLSATMCPVLSVVFWIQRCISEDMIKNFCLHGFLSLSERLEFRDCLSVILYHQDLAQAWHMGEA